MAHKVVEVVTLASLCVCMASCATASFEEIDTSDQEVVDKTCEREYSIDLDDGFNERVSPEDYVDEDGKPFINYRMCRRSVVDKYDVCINAVTDKYCGVQIAIDMQANSRSRYRKSDLCLWLRRRQRIVQWCMYRCDDEPEFLRRLQNGLPQRLKRQTSRLYSREMFVPGRRRKRRWQMRQYEDRSQ